MLVTSEHLNYLQRIGLNNDSSQLTDQGAGGMTSIKKVFKINGYSQFSKDVPLKAEDLPSKDILCGLFGEKIPVAFFIAGSSSSIDFFVGTWTASHQNPNDAGVEKELNDKLGIILSNLESGYPALNTDKCASDVMSIVKFSQAGLVMGVPTVKKSEAADSILPIERLIRTMNGLNWGCLILAQPVNQAKTNDLRLTAIDEMKRASGSSQQGENPLASYYINALQQTVVNLTFGLMNGVWRTGVYLLGDENSYSRLTSAWTGIFSGDESYPDSISVLKSEKVLELARNWKLPDAPEVMAPGRYQHPLKYQSLLNSTQLSAYIHLPQRETSGFSINILPNFDVIPPKTKSERTIKIGEVIHWAKPTCNSYSVDLDKLNGHLFVSGITGCGKTNTIFQILTQVYAFNMPFLVIEPAKREYRALLRNPIFKDKLQVFTPGNEMISPFRLNPFEVVSWPVTTVSGHIDYLRSVFSASFGMWEPLPQILESCLFAIYADKGWDITTNTNSRFQNSQDLQYAFPTLSDLADKVGVIITKSGYEDKIKDDMRSALLTRIDSLRIGGKGKMLDVQNSLPMKMILETPTVLELEGMGDDDDKAFIMGLLFIRLVEYRFACAEKSGLQHLLIIEEAHRLLSNVPIHGGAEEANPRGKAVEAFSNLISEVRSHGQGLIIVDQVPVKLAPDAIKNTNMKIIHRCVSVEDRAILAGATAMNEVQSNSINTFTTGQAAVSSDGDDKPILVQVGRSPDHENAPTDQELSEWMKRPALSNLYHPQFEIVLEAIKDTNPVYIELGRALGHSLMFQEKISRIIFSIFEGDEGMQALFENMMASVREKFKEGLDFEKFRKAVFYFAADYYSSTKGNFYKWSFQKTNELSLSLIDLLFAMPENKNIVAAVEKIRSCLNFLYERSFEPYFGCNKVCDHKMGVCLYRSPVSEFIMKNQAELQAAFNSAYVKDKENKKNLELTIAECSKSPDAILNQNIQDSVPAKRMALCYAQQMIKDQPMDVHDIILDALITEMNSL
jgi:Helicase HerA, central domain